MFAHTSWKLLIAQKRALRGIGRSGTPLYDSNALSCPDPPDDACSLTEPHRLGHWLGANRRIVPGALAVPEGAVKLLEKTGVIP